MIRRKILTGAGAALFGVTLAASAAPPSDRLAARSAQLPAGIEQLRLPQPASGVTADLASVDPALRDAEGRQEVIVRLRSPSVAKARGKSPSQRMSHKLKLQNEQSTFMRRTSKSAKSMKKVASVQTVLNAVFLEVDAKDIPKLAADRDVFSINRVKHYEIDLPETVPYIGASAVQAAGFDGTGVTVAVLDSGVDYYHADLGGTGNVADYLADNPTVIEPGTFPTGKVVGGFDYVGSDWPTGDRTEDPDPLDDSANIPGAFAGHGTHVADIIGGAKGVAPGASIYGLKVCASFSSSCNGVALIKGMEFSVDPNGDGDPSDAVDIINMSLGANYGQPFDDDLSAAVEGATALGVLTVSSAGNGTDKPYVTGTPSSTPSALSVAQTAVPSANLPRMEVIEPAEFAGLYDAVQFTWSGALTSVISGPATYAGTLPGVDSRGCDVGGPGGPNPFLDAGVMLDGITMVDRGACRFDEKVQNIEEAGGTLGIVGLVTPEPPFAGGGDPIVTIPGFMIGQGDADIIRLNDAVVSFDPANGIALVGTMVSSSSRGPQHEDTTLLKPEIGAPGASVSALAGSGSGVEPFGGTSGASPMVAGSAALLLQAYPGLIPAEVKARLMNTGYTDITTGPGTELAPITRIGGGEVRVDRALATPAAAWDNDTLQGGLSFGFVDVDKDTVVLHKKVRVRNYSDDDVSYSVTPTFRYQEDADTGAISVSVPPGKVKVKAGKDAVIPVKMTITGANLPGNFMSSGSSGADAGTLTANEFDGYLVLDDGSQPIHLPWHVLPRKAANVVGRKVLNVKGGVDVVNLTNNGVGTAQIDAYSLVALSPDLPEGGLGEQSPTPDIRAVGVNTFPTAGCGAGFIWAFAVNTWERQQHLLPVRHFIYLDTDQDGTDDYAVFNSDFSALVTGALNQISDGRQVSLALNLATGDFTVFFFAEHATNTGNTVLLVCGEQVGLTSGDILSTNVDVRVETLDFYYGGPGDLVDGLTITPLGERYFGVPSGDIEAGQVGSVEVTDFGPFPGNSEELGIMLITNGDRGTGARGGATEATETLLLTTDRPPADRRGGGGFGKK